MSEISTAISDNALEIVCKLCRRQFAKYTCPSCNIPYCSLTCFRSESHGQCSEGFYRKEVESQIRTEPSKSKEERQKMMELLKRFEEENIQETEVYDADGDDDDDTSALAKRLQDTNLDAIPPEDLWSMLSPAQQKKFMQVVQDPSGDLAQQLLAHEQIDRDNQPPWWEANSQPFQGEGSLRNKPDPIAIPPSMVKPPSGGPSLLYNVAGVLISYAYATRYFTTSPLSNSPELSDAQNCVARLVPFLTDRKATTTFSSVENAAIDIYSRMPSDKASKKALSIYMKDAAQLLRPLQIISIDEPPTPPSSSLNFDYSHHPHRTAALAMSDLHNLFATSTAARSSDRRVNHTTQKIVFYAARVLALPSHVLQMVAEELLAYAEIMKREDDNESRDLRSGNSSQGAEIAPRKGTSRPLVAEV